ncbi:hypothetical protein HDU84_008020 [Entophlyctis sp. JEL0112]|nr:hypothetical protein HDU84_008020 [Entophlyctis sp. JEL0112]
MRVHDILSSSSMATRDSRLKEAKQNAEKCNRRLARDRNHLDAIEQKLMNDIRTFSKKGDLVKARIAAKQISHYRTASDRNYESAAIIATRAQLMASNHKINQAKIEAIKGSRYACMNDTIQTVSEREMKYAHMMDIQEEMERIMNEGMDEVYETAEDLIKKRDYFDLEVDAILKQALDPKLYNGRTYTTPQKQTTHQFTINFKLYNPRCVNDSQPPRESFSSRFPATPGTKPGSGSFNISPISSMPGTPAGNHRVSHTASPKYGSLRVPTLDLSVDMLKRLMIRDAFLMSQLELQNTKNAMYDIVLGTSKPFRIGKINDVGAFEEFEFVKSLKELGVGDGGLVWVLVG